MICTSSAAAYAHPDLTGVWQLASTYQPEIKTSDGKVPPLHATASAIYAKHRAAYRAGDRSFDPAADGCGNPGMPRIMMMPNPFQIIQDTDRVVTLFPHGDRFRIVELKRNLEPVDLFYFGTPNGHWDHDELVVESTDFRDNTLLDAGGMPHSDALKVMERYKLSKDGQRLTDQITVTDPKTFERPWTTTTQYRKLPLHSQSLSDVEQPACGPPALEAAPKGGS
jgi:hypothetical protein